MNRDDEAIERFEMIWVLSALIISFRFAFSYVETALGSPEPAITRFLCGSTLGFCLGSSLAMAGLPIIHLVSDLKKRISKRREHHDQPQSVDSANS